MWRAPRPDESPKHGKASATMPARATYIALRSRSLKAGALSANFPRTPRLCVPCRASVRIRQALWRHSRTSDARRWSTRMSRACCDAFSRRRSTRKAQKGIAASGRLPSRFSRGRGGQRGRTTRRSWSLVRWCALPALHTAIGAPYALFAGRRNPQRENQRRAGGIGSTGRYSG